TTLFRSSGSNEGIEVNAPGFTCNGLRMRSLRIEWDTGGTGSTFNDCHFVTPVGSGRIGTVSADDASFYRCSFRNGSGQEFGINADDVYFESCLWVEFSREALIVASTAGDVSIINGTIVTNGGVREALQTDQTGAATLTLHNTIIRAENGLAFLASDPTWN